MSDHVAREPKSGEPNSLTLTVHFPDGDALITVTGWSKIEDAAAALYKVGQIETLRPLIENYYSEDGWVE